MNRVVVGSTGLVGGNVLRSGRYDAGFHSANVAQMRGQEFETVVFAAARAEKWRINQDPDSDRRHIEELSEILAGFTTQRLVLVSTVDVFRSPVAVDETSPVDLEGLHPYGLHRYELELAARDLHPETTVMRLPGLYGPGLKKNVIFDLMHDNGVDRLHPDGLIQYYDLRRLADDIDLAVASDLGLVHLASEPISTGVLARDVFGVELAPQDSSPPRYDMRSIHATAFGGEGSYVTSATQTVAGIRDFVAGAAPSR